MPSTVSPPALRRRARSVVLPLLPLLAMGACASEAAPSGGAKLAIAVSPLDLDSIDEVSFTLSVTNSDSPPDVVWTKSGLLSTQYGTGKGDLSYVGPCDASASPNRVTLTIDSITADGRPLGEDDWRNPTPLTLETPCRENADTPVIFNLTIMRSADQGFFDIGVNFSDIFCSAKVDCQPELLHNPSTNARALTAVLGFACTAGEDQNTTLYFDDLKVVCDGSPVRTYVLNPSPTLAGNQGPLAGAPAPAPGSAPGLFETAVYWGDEDFANLDKCYWNQAIGLDLATLGPNCRLRGEATAADHQLAGLATPPNTVYPKIVFDVPLTGANGQLVCEANPLDGATDGVITSGVRTAYTDFASEKFSYERRCGHPPTTEPPLTMACKGPIVGLPAVSFEETAAGVIAKAGTNAATYALPSGVHFTECCGDLCCKGTP